MNLFDEFTVVSCFLKNIGSLNKCYEQLKEEYKNYEKEQAMDVYMLEKMLPSS